MSLNSSGTALTDMEPLAVTPRQACVLLGIGNTRLYQLIGNGELVSYNEGRARRVTLASIRSRVVRLAAANSKALQPRRQRKLHASETLS